MARKPMPTPRPKGGRKKFVSAFASLGKDLKTNKTAALDSAEPKKNTTAASANVDSKDAVSLNAQGPLEILAAVAQPLSLEQNTDISNSSKVQEETIEKAILPEDGMDLNEKKENDERGVLSSISVISEPATETEEKDQKNVAQSSPARTSLTEPSQMAAETVTAQLASLMNPSAVSVAPADETFPAL